MNTSLLRITALVVIFGSASYAETVGPTYPAPGNNNYFDLGTLGQAPGHTGFYTNFDSTQFSQLFWGLTDVSNPYNDSFSSSTGLMHFQGYNASTGVATWVSTANLQYFTQNSVASYPTEFLMQVQPFTGTNGGQLGAGWLAPATDAPGDLTGNSGPVWDVTGNFQVWGEFVDANNGAGVDTVFNENNSGNGVIQTGYDGAFWSTSASTPEPATFGLIGFALAGLGLLKRRAQ